MTKIVLMAEVEDVGSWETGFRSHAGLFKKMGFASVYEYAIGDDSTVAVCVDVADKAGFLTSLESPENVAAMESDGVKRDTVKVFVLDKALPVG